MADLQLETMLVSAETTLAGARATASRLGMDAEAGAMPILINALAMAVADMAGPSADQARLNRVTDIACSQLADMIAPVWVVRTRKAASQ